VRPQIATLLPQFECSSTVNSSDGLSTQLTAFYMLDPGLLATFSLNFAYPSTDSERQVEH
jgi:hypothetical protein